MPEELTSFGSVTVYMNENGLFSRVFMFDKPFRATQTIGSVKPRMFRMLSGEASIDVWACKKHGTPKNLLESYEVSRTIKLPGDAQYVKVEEYELVRMWSPTRAEVIEVSLQRYPMDDYALIEAGDVRETPMTMSPSKVDDREVLHVLTVEEWNAWARAGRPQECKVKWMYRLPCIVEADGLAVLLGLLKGGS